MSDTASEPELEIDAEQEREPVDGDEPEPSETSGAVVVFPSWLVPQSLPAHETFVDRAQAEQFARFVFGGMSGYVNLRAIEEPKPEIGKPRVRNWWCPINDDLPSAIGDYVENCASEGYAAFLVPFAVAEGSANTDGLRSTRVFAVDIDNGDIEEKVTKLTKVLGEPWLTINSGGKENGQPKVHLYYRLEQEAGVQEFARLKEIRAKAAFLVGADTTVAKNFGQPLRVPGSKHNKNPNAPSACTLTSTNQRSVVTLDTLSRALNAGGEGTLSNVIQFSTDFSGDKPRASMERVLTQPILAECKSPDGLTRYEGSGSAIGHYVRLMRDPVTMWSEVEARQAARDWNAATNIPPWDDAQVMYTFDRLLRRDIDALGPMPTPTPALSATEWARFDQWTGDKFSGVPTPRKYLIDGVLPLAVPGVVAASGGLGKSFLMLDLAYRIATGSPKDYMDFSKDELIFGGVVKEFGTAVVFCAEDDQQTIHERLCSLDPGLKRCTPRLRLIPLPDAGGPRALFAADREGYKTTPEYEAIRAWLKTLPDLKFVAFDPLQTLVAADITTKPEAGQFVMSALGTLAVELGANVLVTHHVKKTERAIRTSDDARAAIRGTTALVDGVRWVYALWDTEDARSDRVVAAGAVVKANSKSDTRTHKYERLPYGVLRQLPPSFSPDVRADILDALAEAIGAAAKAGAPFTMTGANGLYEQRGRLPIGLRKISKARFETLSTELYEAGRIVKTTARGGGKGRNWLDLPEGDIAMGVGAIMSGAGVIAA